MKLTSERKNQIDAKSYRQLLQHNRFAPTGDPWFEGETGIYWLKRMGEMRDKNPGEAVTASKSIGWEKLNEQARGDDG